MSFRKALLAIVAVMVIASVTLAQADKKAHGPAKAKASAKGAEDASSDHMTAKDLKARLDKGDKIIIVDARHELGGQILKDAVHVPSDNLEDWAKTIDKSAVIVTYCTCPHDEAADAEMKKLRELGFKNAYSLTGGMDAAKAAGIEVVKPTE